MIHNPIEIWNELANIRRGELTMFGAVAASHGAPVEISTNCGVPKSELEVVQAAQFLRRWADDLMAVVDDPTAASRLPLVRLGIENCESGSNTT